MHVRKDAQKFFSRAKTGRATLIDNKNILSLYLLIQTEPLKFLLYFRVGVY